MKEFTDLILKLERITETNEKISALAEYFKSATETDKLWAVQLLFGNSPKRAVTSTQLKGWAIEFSKLPYWLFEDSYSIVGDLSETITLILPKASNSKKEMPITLEGWVKFIKAFGVLKDEEKKIQLFEAWDSLNFDERFVFNKLILGNFRVGVSKNLVVKALSKVIGIKEPVLYHRFAGIWDPEKLSLKEISSNSSFNIATPYPFFLSSSLENNINELGKPNEWIAEWKWDGIRSQIVKRNDEIFIWSRGEELVTEKFPEFNSLIKKLPNGTVIDGELLAYSKTPLSFNLLQQQIRQLLDNFHS